MASETCPRLPPLCEPSRCHTQSLRLRVPDTPLLTRRTTLHTFGRPFPAPPVRRLPSSAHALSPQSNQIPFDRQSATQFQSPAFQDVRAAAQRRPASLFCKLACRPNPSPNTARQSVRLLLDSTPCSPRRSGFPTGGRRGSWPRRPIHARIPSSESLAHTSGLPWS